MSNGRKRVSVCCGAPVKAERGNKTCCPYYVCEACGLWPVEVKIIKGGKNEEQRQIEVEGKA